MIWVVRGRAMGDVLEPPDREAAHLPLLFLGEEDSIDGTVMLGDICWPPRELKLLFGVPTRVLADRAGVCLGYRTDVIGRLDEVTRGLE